ncbi:MAG TPA: N-acetylmuramoyl-L-alanine amidase [Xanthomonadales bacterium]|nr:N-acetylmuramoyl-L-alanine amidase [Xanthomonadales bacterium]
MIRQRPLPYEQLLAHRSLDQVDLLVIHCTELPDLATARQFGEKILYPAADNRVPAPDDSLGTGNSGHYYIDRDGSIEQWVSNARIAHHVRSYNPRSIGIELVNRGRYPHWFHANHQQMTEPYPQLQVAALVQLVNVLQESLPELRWIAGHAELDMERVAASNDASIMIQRKLDPGPLFPWPQVLASCRLQRFQP